MKTVAQRYSRRQRLLSCWLPEVIYLFMLFPRRWER